MFSRFTSLRGASSSTRARAAKANVLRRSLSSRAALNYRPSATLTSLFHHLRARPFLYGGALVAPFGFALYDSALRRSPHLAEKYSGIASRYDPNLTIMSILGVNAAVFLMWQMRSSRFKRFMGTHFLLRPQTALSPRRWHTFLTSMFSHATVLHFLFNSYALVTFSSELHQAVGRENFLGMYIGGGIAGGFGQVLWNRVFSKSRTPSLGASAGVLAIVAASVAHRPDHGKIGIIFLPSELALPPKMALAAIMALDVAGLVLGWKTFAHGAHLAGTVFGLASFSLLARSPVGTREDGERLVLTAPYEGPLKEFKPTGRGVLHGPDRDFHTKVNSEGTLKLS